MIEDYSFGYVRIGGREYRRDVIVRADGTVHSPWWRAEGHSLAVEDLEPLLDEPPGILIVGTGYHGRMAVPEETRAALEACGMEVRALPTREAVAEFNRLACRSGAVAAALHLTC